MFDFTFSSSASLGAITTTGMSRVHQRERAVLELARGIGLGVDVGDLLQLERAFERDRVVDAAPEEQRVLALGEALGPAWICGSRFSACWMLPGTKRSCCDRVGAPRSGVKAPLRLGDRERRA